MLKINPPTMDEVTFSYELQEEDMDYRGNFSFGDEEEDRKTEEWIARQLARGNLAAWCVLVVRAEWRGFRGVSSLGGCSYKSEEDLLTCLLADHREEAFLDLRSGVQRSFAEILDRIEVVPDVASERWLGVDRPEDEPGHFPEDEA